MFVVKYGCNISKVIGITGKTNKFAKQVKYLSDHRCERNMDAKCKIFVHVN